MILMESASKIRRMILRDEQSICSVGRETGLSRHTITKYVNDASPPNYRRQVAPVQYKLQEYGNRLQTLFGQDLLLPRRECRTAVKLCESFSFFLQL